MNKIKWIALLAGLTLGGTAQAGITDGVGTWKGSGTAFGAGGQELGDFTVEMVRTAIDAHTVEGRGKVVLATGEVITFRQRMIEHGNSFSMETDRGRGGGHCFGGGLCTSYEDLGSGKAYATTIVVDTPSKIRILVTELQGGRAVRFMRQELTKRE
jgi:hypothetical protein